jgi:NCS2 family nucleobase:cation symporter-2/xanthine permease XanP
MASTLYDNFSRKPPLPLALWLGFQHLLVMFGGVVTAPLILATAMQLPPAEVRYLISASLFISGVATLLQIRRIGVIGSGLLSVQGTSFTFIGPLLFCYFWLLQDQSHSPAQALGILFGSCAVCALLVLALCPFIRKLAHLITTNVSGTTVILIGMTLVSGTLQNLWGVFAGAGDGAGPAGGPPLWQLALMAGIPFGLILLASCSRQPWLRMTSVALGLLAGYGVALLAGAVDFSAMQGLPAVFVPEFSRYEPGVSLTVVLIMLPVFVVSMSESIGDFTVTSALSGLPVHGEPYWQRVRGGLMADSVNSLLAALFSTFPNTTFSQNNGVIRLTGVASPYIGAFVAVFLIALGALPVVAAAFQSMPAAVLFGATLLMFAMVGLSGLRVVLLGQPRRRDWLVVGIAIASAGLIPALVQALPGLPEPVSMLLQFPVSTGAFMAVLAELLLPRAAQQAPAPAMAPEPVQESV